METNEAILKTLRRIEDSQASMDRDLEKDRQNLQDLTIRIEAVESELRQIRQAVNLSAERTRDRVAEVVEPVITSADKLAAQINKKRVMVLRGKTWWQKLWKS